MTTKDADALNKPHTKLAYPIPHDGGDGFVHVFGPSDAKQIIIMSAGFPDDHSAFTPMASRLAEETGALVGVTCLPGFDRSLDMSRRLKFGYSFSDWVICLRESVKKLREYSTAPASETELIGIFHDWAVISGLQFCNQMIAEENQLSSLDRLVLFDVLVMMHPRTPNKPPKVDAKRSPMYWMIPYQLFFAMTFVIQCFLPGIVAAVQIILFSKVLGALRLFPSGPMDYEYINHLRQEDPAFWKKRLPYMCYPYFFVWKNVLSGKAKSIFANSWLPLDLKNTPVLFMYGLEKNVLLHGAREEALLEREQEQGNLSKVVLVERAGHWLYYTQFDSCFQEVKGWLSQKKKR